MGRGRRRDRGKKESESWLGKGEEAKVVEVESYRRAFQELGLDAPADVVATTFQGLVREVREELFPHRERESIALGRVMASDEEGSAIVERMGLISVFLMAGLILYAARSDLWPSRFPPQPRPRHGGSSKSN